MTYTGKVLNRSNASNDMAVASKLSEHDIEQKLVAVSSVEGLEAPEEEAHENSLNSHLTSSWTTFCSVVLTCYMPCCFQLATGALQIIYSVVMGHVVRRWISDEHQQQQPYYWSIASLFSSKHYDAAPPPALVGLAMLTIVCLVIHPEGATWIVIRTLRYVVCTFHLRSDRVMDQD